MSAVTGSPEPSTARTLTVTLPLPDPLLTLNVRMHWAAKAREVARQRYDARIGTYAQLPEYLPAWVTVGGRIRLDVEVRPRPRMKRLDDDNCWAALKSYRDGIADALLVDDRVFVIGTLTWARERTGELVVTLTAI